MGAIKRSIAVLCSCALVLCMATLSGCSAQQTKSDEVHLLFKVPRTGHNVVFDDSITQIDQVIKLMVESFERDYDKANVDIEIEVFEQNQYGNAIEDDLGTDEAPDILYGDYFNMSTYIHTGKVISLDDVVTDEVHDGIFEYMWEMSTVKGRVYMMPYLARQNILAYNKSLFQQAGLGEFVIDDEISSWSLEEWTYILDTLSAELPESVYPMMMYALSFQGDTHIMTLLRSAGSEFFDETGHFNISTPEGIAALRWIQDGVDKGWFPPHSENLEIEDCSSLFRQGQLAIYMINNASIDRYGDSVGLVNFPGPDDGCATAFVSGFEVFDNGDPKKIEIAKDFLSYVYGHDDLMAYAAGTLPASQAVSDRYSEQIQKLDLFLENRSNVVDFTGNNPNTIGVREVFYECIHQLLMHNISPEEAAAMIDERCNAAIDEGLATSVLHE